MLGQRCIVNSVLDSEWHVSCATVLHVVRCPSAHIVATTVFNKTCNKFCSECYLLVAAISRSLGLLNGGISWIKSTSIPKHFGNDTQCFGDCHTVHISVTRREVDLTSVGDDRSYQQFSTRSLYSSRVAETAPFCFSISQIFEDNNMPEMCAPLFYIITHF
jgi:hypothetical protein